MTLNNQSINRFLIDSERDLLVTWWTFFTMDLSFCDPSLGPPILTKQPWKQLFGAEVNSEERKLDRCYPGSERRNQRSVNKTLFFQVLWRLTSGHARAERTLRIWADSWSSGLRTPSRRVFLSADPTRYQTSTLQGHNQLGSTLTFSGGKKKSRPCKHSRTTNRKQRDQFLIYLMLTCRRVILCSLGSSTVWHFYSKQNFKVDFENICLMVETSASEGYFQI